MKVMKTKFFLKSFIFRVNCAQRKDGLGWEEISGTNDQVKGARSHFKELLPILSQGDDLFSDFHHNSNLSLM